MQRGFTLIQISILLLVASLVLVAMLPSTRTSLNANNATTTKMNAILTAMRTYQAAHAALPCPADASQPTAGATYGVAAANPGTGSTGNCTGGTPAANFVDTTNNVTIGMVPVRALGLSNDYALDGYGRDITYAVDTNATVCWPGTLAGKIMVTDNGTINNSVAALVSHGTDGHGAWIPLTGSTGTAVRLNAGSTDTDQLINAHLTSAFAATSSSLLPSAENTTTTFVRKPRTPTFDDLLVYKSSLWTLNNTPVSASGLIPSLTPPANNNYYTGQTLTFTVTYGTSVTVTGTPELTLSIPQQNGTTATHYATYTGSSGNTMTFTYTVLSSDYAPSGISMSSPIVLSGGSISVGGAAACLTFSPPSLTGVLLNPVIIYVVDSGGNRVEMFNINGTYIGQIGGCSSGACSSGSGNGQFNFPEGLAWDNSGNLWVGDTNNSRLEEFSAAGTYMSTNNNGNLYGSPIFLAFDSSNNVWATCNYGHVCKFNAAGSYLMQFPVGGQPSGLAIDASGNIYFSSFDAAHVWEYNTSGSTLATSAYLDPGGFVIDPTGTLWIGYLNGYAYVGGFNSSLVANGTFIGSTYGGVTGIALDPSGDFWIVDSGAQQIDEYTYCGVAVTSFGSAGSGNGQFNNPVNIAIYPNTPGGGGACIASVTPPSNGAYSTGQTLQFTVTYNGAVTVTGLPQLVLTIGSNTRYATYSSGSGTNALTFTYTIQSTDSATGMAVGTSISLNGGTITTGSTGIAANLGYTAPAMGGITINSTSFMLVADNANDRVQKLDLLGNFLGQYGCTGNSGCPDAGTANGQLYKPYDVALDGGGNVWVMDSYNYRVEEFSSSGTYIGQIGCVSGGCAGNGFGSGPGQFDDSATGIPPTGITIDGNGNIWAIDSGDTRVEKFNSSSTYQTQLGTTNTTGCTPSLFQDAQYVHYDPSNNIYVADAYCGTIQEFTNAGSYVKTFGPTIPGYGTFSQDVDDFAFDSCGNIWVQDEGNNNNLVELDYAGNYITSGSLSGYVGGEQSIAIDSSGNIYSLDEDSNGVLVINPTSGFVRQFGSAGSGPAQFNGAEGLILVGTGVTRLAHSACPAVILSTAGPSNGTYTTSSTLGFAVTYDQAVTVTGTPQLPVAIGTNERYANYISGSGTTTLTFQYTVVAGDNSQGGAGMTMDVPINLNGGTISSNGIASDLYYQPPSMAGVLINPVSYSNFYIADSANHRVREVTASTGFISTVAGTGTSGAITSGAAATSSKLNTPTGVALDGSGNLYIADTGDHSVLKVTESTGKIAYFAGTGTSGTITAGTATSSKLNAPAGVAFDTSGNAYIADSGNHEVLKVNTSGTLSIFAGTGASGTITAGAATSSKLNSPTGVAVDSSGNVYIADGGNHAVLKVNTSGSLAYFAGTGSSGSTHDNDGTAATSAKLKTPYGVTVDSSGNVYIADSGNDVILKVTASTGKISIAAGTVGTASYSGDGGAGTSATESAAQGVAVDTSGNVYIADTGNDLIRWYFPTFSTINLLAGNGTGGYSGDGAAATSGEINAPTGLAVSR